MHDFGPTLEDEPAVRRLARCARAGSAAIDDNERVDYWAESDLAWELAEAIDPLIPDGDRAGIYGNIGAGHSYTAICALLEIAVCAKAPVPPELAGRLVGWLDAYAYNDHASHLLELLKAVTSREDINRPPGIAARGRPPGPQSTS